MSLVLALDTVTHLCSCALYKQGICIGRQCDDLGRGHGEHLVDQIDILLHQAKIDKKALDRIGVSTGPGSFTGMRVGVAFARGLGLALGISAIGVSRFEAINYGLRHFLSEKPKCKSAVILESVQDLVSYQIFDTNGTALSSPRQEKAASLMQQLLGPLEHFPKSGNRFLDKKCGKNKELEQRSDSIKSHSALILSGDGCTKLVSLGMHHDLVDMDIQPLSREAELDAIAAIAAACPVAQTSPSPLYLRSPDAKPMQRNITTNQR